MLNRVSPRRLPCFILWGSETSNKQQEWSYKDAKLLKKSERKNEQIQIGYFLNAMF